jgi:hypothetical protein
MTGHKAERVSWSARIYGVACDYFWGRGPNALGGSDIAILPHHQHGPRLFQSTLPFASFRRPPHGGDLHCADCSVRISSMSSVSSIDIELTSFGTALQLRNIPSL